MSAVREERDPLGAIETIVEPQSAEEIADLVRKCEADMVSLAPIGAARTLSQIRRTPAQIGISLRRMASIVAYEPEDMTVVARAGLTVGNLNATLATPGQRLPVDPREPDATTLGSLIAAAHAGPLRLSEGTVRDLLIGIQFVGHGGRIVRAGGRVVKNVAGYDLMKVMTGSFGTLGIVTEVTFKVRPIPENYRLAVAAFPDAEAAFAAASNLHDQVPLIHLEVTSRAASAAIGASVRFLVLAGFAGIHSELNYLSGRIAKCSRSAQRDARRRSSCGCNFIPPCATSALAIAPSPRGSQCCQSSFRDALASHQRSSSLTSVPASRSCGCPPATLAS